MHLNQHTQLSRRKVVIFSGLVLLLVLGVVLTWNFKERKKEPYLVGVILSQAELKPGEMEVYKLMLASKTKEINKTGGINGHKIKPLYLDDNLDDNRLLELVEQSSNNKNLIAYIGCRGLGRARKIAPVLEKKNIPLIGLYVYTDSLQQYPNMYTASVGTMEAKLVLQELLKSRASKVGFIGEKGKTSSENLHAILKVLIPGTPGLQFTIQKFLSPKIHTDIPNQKAFVDSLKNNVDFLIINTSASNCDSLFNLFYKYQLDIPAFVNSSSTDVLDLNYNNPAYRSAELFNINTFGISGTQNSRLMEAFSQLKRKPEIIPSAYLVSLAGRLADELGIIHEAAITSSLSPDKAIRERINLGLKNYVGGRRIYHGWLTDWYFTPERAYSGESLISWKPKNSGTPMLGATQYIRSGNKMIAAPVFYTNINMIEISQVTEDDQTFYASFYLELQTNKDIDLSLLDFSNAVRNELDHTPILDAKLIRSRKDDNKPNFYQRIYKVSGLFRYEPDLKNYPLDKQKFFITLQAANAWKPVFIQPSAQEERDSVFESEGWKYKGQYIGFNQDIIVTPQAFGFSSRNIQNHKFTYTYIMQRSQIDFFLKTLVPLLAIITVAYFSVYIPMREFEALAGIQVTALLSSIALYFATYKPQTPYATISDKLFIFTYIMVTSLIGCSILLYVMYRQRSWLLQVARTYQRYIFPFIIIGFLWYIKMK